ncbi:hypothetical protein BDW74DRAFT_146698 [Aspergillus multicolor]|uniref:uncharacterized protein n=1 Tax=Aspergillus multicolor TaxID=41759 RepID=UPI003CCE3828
MEFCITLTRRRREEGEAGCNTATVISQVQSRLQDSLTYRHSVAGVAAAAAVSAGGGRDERREGTRIQEEGPWSRSSPASKTAVRQTHDVRYSAYSYNPLISNRLRAMSYTLVLMRTLFTHTQAVKDLRVCTMRYVLPPSCLAICIRCCSYIIIDSLRQDT